MLKTLVLLAAVSALPLAAQCCGGACCGHTPAAPTAVKALPAAESPTISDKVGRAGMVASVVKTTEWNTSEAMPFCAASTLETLQSPTASSELEKEYSMNARISQK